MNKKMIIVLFIAIGLVMGGTFLSQKAYAASHTCWVPYNIKTGAWWTGINFRTDYFVETLTIRFAYETTVYETVTLEITNSVWTGNVQDLLAVPSSFQSPTFLLITSKKGKFMVTQFVGNTGSVGGGFGFQTFYSYPDGSWPYTTTLSEPFLEPPGVQFDSFDGLPVE